MLTRIPPEQVSDQWPVISFAIEQSLPPFVTISETYMSSILASLLVGKLTCWVSTNKSGTIDAIATTQIIFDESSGTSSLLIYSTYGFGHIEDQSWVSAFTTISAYAKNMKCQKVSCYTTNDRIIEQAKKFGGEMQTFISFNL